MSSMGTQLAPGKGHNAQCMGLPSLVLLGIHVFQARAGLHDVRLTQLLAA